MIIAWIGRGGHTTAIRRALRLALPTLVSAAYAAAPPEAANLQMRNVTPALGFSQ